VNEKLDFWGIDLAATAMLTDNWALQGTTSFVSDDHFDTSVGTVTLNAPRWKGSLAAQYRTLGQSGFNGELRVRYNNEFPFQSGVYQGTACIVDTPADPCVESYTLLDMVLGYTLPEAFRGAALQLSIQNLLDEAYRSYPGTQSIGRLAMLRLRYTF
jgi:outer membrane receptor protein involved in Fe transport